MSKVTVFFKSIGTLAVVAFSYLTHTLSPLIWVLLALVILDLLLHIHKGVQMQWTKLWSACAALGLPTYLATNSSKLVALSPDVLKVVVAALCIGYIQVIMPVVIKWIGGLHISKDPAQNAVDVAALQATVAKLEQTIEARAEAQAKPLQQPPAGV